MNANGDHGVDIGESSGWAGGVRADQNGLGPPAKAQENLMGHALVLRDDGHAAQSLSHDQVGLPKLGAQGGARRAQ